MRYSTGEQYALMKTKTLQSISITRVLKLLLVRDVFFIPQSTLIPEELELEVAHLPYNVLQPEETNVQPFHDY
jgi:hypothetical protein